MHALFGALKTLAVSTQEVADRCSPSVRVSTNCPSGSWLDHWAELRSKRMILSYLGRHAEKLRCVTKCEVTFSSSKHKL